jgi:hypothetical protein
MAYPKTYPKVLTKAYPKVIGAINSFDIEIDTTKTEVGSSTSSTVILPLVSGLAYDFNIDWGDSLVESYDSSSLASITRTYSASGVYTIKIWGTFPRINYNNSAANDKLKITKIKNWGIIEWSSLQTAFFGCANLVADYADFPNLSAVTNTNTAFRNAVLWNGDLSSTNMDLVVDAGNMYYGASAFNQPFPNMPSVIVLNNTLRNTPFNQNIDNLTMLNVTSAINFMSGNTGFSQENYDSWLGVVDNTNVNSSVTAHFDSATYTDTSGHDWLATTKSWSITDGGAA